MSHAVVRQQTVRSIQYLRGAAALAVVLFHTVQWMQSQELTRFAFPTGAAGVDVFFVISGFVMWASTDEAPPTPGAFLWRRAVRILPPYWLFTLLAAAGALWAPHIFQDVHVTWRHLALSLALIPHLNPQGDGFPVLKTGWTLIYEAIFYLIFAVGLRFPRNMRLIFLAGALTTVAAIGLVSPQAYVLFADPLMFEFLAGVGVAVLWRSGRLGSRRRGALLIALALAAFVALQIVQFDDYDWRPLFWGAPAVLLVAGAVDLEAAGFGRPSRVLKLIGDGSYSIYLCHTLVIELFVRLYDAPNAWVFLPAALVLSIGGGLIARQLVEKPTLRWLHGVGRAMPGFETAAET